MDARLQVQALSPTKFFAIALICIAVIVPILVSEIKASCKYF